uniref:ADP-ribosylation factor-like protein 2 n=1 Tax=Fibrocapsa japonica TaxID=94617 RepID=A0A7S2V1M1_9STRA
MRILILGLDNAGKTTIVKRFNGEDISEIEPTLGFDIRTLQHRGYVLNVWDVGGQQTIRSYWRNYFEQTDGLIWVVDSADRVRLEDCRRELHALLTQEKLGGASLLVLANKQDIEGALSVEAIATALGLKADGDPSSEDASPTIFSDPSFATRHWSIAGCSAVSGQGLLQGVDWIVDDIAARIFMLA